MSCHRHGRPAARTPSTPGFAGSAARHAALALRAGPPQRLALAALATAPPALPRRTLRLSRLQRSAAHISEPSAALQSRLRGRRFEMPRTHAGHRHALALRASGRDKDLRVELGSVVIGLPCARFEPDVSQT